MNKLIKTASFAWSLLLAAAPAGAETTDYTYDAAGRIAQAACSSGANIGYAYDANGNLLNRQTSSPAGTNYTVATAWKTGGHITPVNPVVVAGASQSFSIVASNGYVLADVLVNAVSVGYVTNYTFNDVRGNPTLLALFEPAGGCSYDVTPAATNFGKEAGSGFFSLTTEAACSWTAETADEWLSLVPASGAGSAFIIFTVSENTAGTARTGTVQIAGESVRVIQHETMAPPPSPPPFRIEEMQRLNDELVITLGWPALPDARYRLSWSTNLLLPFSVLTSNLAAVEEGRMYLSVTNRADMEKAFYLMEEE